MSEISIVDNVLQLLKQNTKFTGSSHLFKFYDKLNTFYGTHENFSVCNEENNLVVQSCPAIEEIMENWDDGILSLFNSPDIDSSKLCDYTFYWLYGKLVEYNFKISNISLVYNKLSSFMKDKCFKGKDEIFYIKKVYDLKELKNKKELYDFVEYSKYLKDIWNDGIGDNKKKYCGYTKYIFELYKEMERKNVHQYISMK
ncbi:CYIR protein [Plasmodium cynomolgi strain B]|uniref:CYIR protein n=1 Tax=Plasmodium cynomolgi (strain B) TaxID=1120755 RepID=K6UF58_PLACD|nr:CYIR protein [Plasmodium cynomolgi strain B]GAB69526.1 CYIR protein [Plasmodium cynomolgi strain B]